MLCLSDMLFGELPLHNSINWLSSKIEESIKELLIFCFILGLLFTFLVPPFQKPDEATHFYKAISVAEGHLVCDKNWQGVFVNPIPQYLSAFPEQMYLQFIRFNQTTAFPKRAYLTALQNNAYSQAYVNEPSSCVLPFPLYLHTGIVLALPVLLGLNPLIIFYLGRLTNFLVSFVIFILAIKLTPRGLRSIPLLTLLLPMTLHQLGSYSKDSLHLACATFVVSCLLAFFSKKYDKNPVVVVLFLLSLTATILARPYFLGLSLLVFLVPNSTKFPKAFIPLFTKFCFVLLLFFVIEFSLSKQIYSADASSIQKQDINVFVSPVAQLHYMKEYPAQFIQTISNTFESKLGFLATSMIGEFGWLDYQLHWYIYLIYVGIIFFVIFVERTKLPKLSWFETVILFLTLLSCVGGICLAFYLYGSPVSSKVIQGLQGRYFIPLLPILIIALSELWIKYRKNLVRSVFVAMLLSITILVMQRYYDSSNYYYRDTFHFPDKNVTSVKSVSSYTFQTLEFDAQRKITGITVIPQKNRFPTSVPYQLTVYDAWCNTVLRKTVLDMSLIQFDELNDLRFSALGSPDGKICFSLNPYVLQPDQYNQLELLSNRQTDQVVAVPLYLY